jgi:ribonucleoside-diphosphate reductase alpha chain
MDKKSKDYDEDLIGEFLDGVACVMVDECFAGDQLVLTPRGYKPIAEIRAGDTIINIDERTGLFKEDTVVKQHQNLPKSSDEDMLELSFNDGKTIKVTANHKFLTNVGWVRADELTENMEIVSLNTRC